MSTIKKFSHYIDGKWITPKGYEGELIVNPATEEVIGELVYGTKDETRLAISVAKETFKKWSQVSIPKRGRYLFELHHLLLENKEVLANLITLENGKSFSESMGEVQRGIENVEHAASIVNLMMGDSLANAASDIEVTNYRYPLGVVGCITPFNFPMMVPFWLFPMAIATGNTVVLKPSEKTPLLIEKMMTLIEKTGIPNGVVNVVNGSHEVVNELLENPEIKAVSFVGSKKAGEYVYKKATANLKRVQVMAGANNHVIILKDANLDKAVFELINASFGSAGERCMAAAVIAVENDIADLFVAKYTSAAKKLVLGNGLKEGVFLGPVIRKEAKERIFAAIQTGVEEGASLLLDGRKKGLNTSGYFIGPTIFDHVTSSMSIWEQELFAPIACITRINSLKEGVDLANSSEFANGACLFTNNTSAVRYFREKIDAGMLGINLGVPAPLAWFAFSGWKNSFFGDLHANGKDAVEFYTHRKVMTARYAEDDL